MLCTFRAAQAATYAPDVEALRALYTSFQTPGRQQQGLGASTWGNSSSDPCEDNWAGIVAADGYLGCTGSSGESNRRVQGISLNGRNLEGSLPISWPNRNSSSLTDALSQLQLLDLGSNSISGVIPPAIGNCTMLYSLELGVNELNSTIPATLCNLNLLTYLSLYSNRLYGSFPACFNELVQLQTLYLDHNYLGGFLPELSNLPQLNELYAGNNLFIGYIPSKWPQSSALQVLSLESNFLFGGIPPSIGDLGQLQQLVLDTNRLNGPIPHELCCLLELQEINLGANLLTGWIPNCISQLEQLTTLNLVQNRLTGPIPESLGLLTQLQNINLGQNCLNGSTPAAFGQLFQLQTLFLGSNCLSGPIPGSLSNLQNLVTLDMSDNFLEGPVPDLRASAPSISTLTLGGNLLSGPIPSSLGQLTALTSLDISFNFLEGPIPFEIAWLQQLTTLNISSNYVSGPIPDCLDQLALLEVLDFSYNELEGNLPRTLGYLSQLQVLWLSVNYLEGEIPSTLSQLGQLQSLYLDTNFFRGPIPDSFEELVQLQYLYLGNNQLNGSFPDSLCNLLQLQELSLAGNNLSGALPFQISMLSNLELLDLSVNSFSQALPASLTTLLSMQFLNLASNKFSGSIPTQLGRLTALTELHMHDNYFTGSLPVSVGALSSLVALTAQDNYLDGLLPSSLSLLTGLETLSLNDNGLQGPLLANFGEMDSLQELHLQNNQFSGQIPDSLRLASRLVDLNISSNNLSGPIPESIGNLSLLQIADVSYNWISGSMPVTLCELRRLRMLHLSENLLTGEIPHCIGQMAKLQSVDISWNNIVGVIPPGVGSLLLLEDLNIANNRLSGSFPDTLFGLQELWYFNGQSNLLSGELPAGLAYLSKLQILDLSGNSFSGSIPNSWQGLTELRSLYLGNNALSGGIPTWLPALQSLSVLDLDTNSLLGHIPGCLAQLVNLTELYLGGNRLTGAIPPDLGNFDNLQVLGLDFNRLNGSIPLELLKLQKLQELYLTFNYLSGEIPSGLLVLPQLAILSLSENLLIGSIPEVSSNSSQSLEQLLLDGNQLTGGIPASIGLLDSLTVLNLRSNSLSGRIPSELFGLTNLQDLNLAFNSFNGPTPSGLANLVNLTLLNLNSNQFSGTMGFTTATFSCLVSLNVSSNPELAVAPNSTLRTLIGDNQEIRSLSFSGIQLPLSFLSDAPLLPKLIVLDVANTAVQGRLDPQLAAKLPSLVHLFLQGNQLSGEIPPLPSMLRSLIGFGNDFQSMPSLQGLHHLTNVVLDGNRQMAGGLPNDWSVFTKLRVLSAQHCSLSGEIKTGLLALSLLGELKIVALRDNKLGGVLQIGSDGARLPDPTSSLRILDLGANSFVGAIPDAIAQHIQLAPGLRVIRFDQNYLSCSLKPMSGVRSDLKNGSLAILEGNSFQCPVPENVQRMDAAASSYRCDTAPWLTDMVAAAATVLLAFGSAAWYTKTLSQTTKKQCCDTRACGGRHIAWLAVLVAAFCVSLVHWGIMYPSMYSCAGDMWGSGAFHQDAEPVTLFITLCLFALSILMYSSNSGPTNPSQALFDAQRIGNHGSNVEATLPSSHQHQAHNQNVCESQWPMTLLSLVTFALWVGFFAVYASIDFGLVLLSVDAWGMKTALGIPHVMTAAVVVTAIAKTCLATFALPSGAGCLQRLQRHLGGKTADISAPGTLFAATTLCAGLIVPLMVALMQMQDCFANKMPWVAVEDVAISFNYDVCGSFCLTKADQTSQTLCADAGQLPGCYQDVSMSQTVSVQTEPLWRGTCSSSAFRLFAPQATLMLAIQAAQLLILSIIQWRSGRTVSELGKLGSRTVLHNARRSGLCACCCPAPAKRDQWVPRPRARSSGPPGSTPRGNVVNPLVALEMQASGGGKVSAASETTEPKTAGLAVHVQGEQQRLASSEVNTEPTGAACTALSLPTPTKLSFQAIQAHVSVLTGAVFGAVYPAACLSCMAALSAYALAVRIAPLEKSSSAPVPSWMRSVMLAVYLASVWFAYGPGSLLDGASADGATGGLVALSCLTCMCLLWINLPGHFRNSVWDSLRH